MQNTFLVLSVSTGILAAGLYIATIVRGTTRPHLVTRGVLCLIAGLAVASILAAGGNAGSLAIASIFFTQSLIIFGLSLRQQASWRMSKFDTSCLIIAVAGIIGWQVSGNPVVGVVFAIVADAVAYVPAFVKTWKRPETESQWFYSIGIISTGLSLMAYKLEAASAFQIWLLVCDGIMLICIYQGRLMRWVR